MKLLSAPNHLVVLLRTASSSSFEPDCPALGNYPMGPSYSNRETLGNLSERIQSTYLQMKFLPLLPMYNQKLEWKRWRTDCYILNTCSDNSTTKMHALNVPGDGRHVQEGGRDLEMRLRPEDGQAPV
ncbi:hypothetical protein CGRA01v4_09195 [Colletotrichum graminicola]|nr:hypothetical protein CGRA01v4_09195 [Colletotrichum graminicola]